MTSSGSMFSDIEVNPRMVATRMLRLRRVEVSETGAPPLSTASATCGAR